MGKNLPRLHSRKGCRRWEVDLRFPSFEALYTVLWYVGPLNNTPGMDFTGAFNGSNAGATAAVYLALAVALGCPVFLIRSRQLRHS